MVDTVGFLQALPHHLIEAFKSTLESALHCDLALIVCDAAGDYEMQLSTTLKTLGNLGFSAPHIVVLNKCDLVPEGYFPRDAVRISAKTGTGLGELKRRIFDVLQDNFVRAELFIPYAQMGEYGGLRPLLTERSVEYSDDGVKISAIIPAIYARQFRRYIK